MNVLSSDIKVMQKFADRITTLENQQIEKEINKIPQDSLFEAKKMMSLIGIYKKISNYFN